MVKKNGGKTYAVYGTGAMDEFEQNNRLLQVNRIHAYGPARYQPDSNTSMWLKMHINAICDRIVIDREANFALRVSKPPKHLNPGDSESGEKIAPPQQDSFL